MKTVLLKNVCLLLCALLAACAASPAAKKSNLITTTLSSYGNAIRWGSLDDAVNFIDPEIRKAHPVAAPSLVGMRVVDYNEKSTHQTSQDEVSQTVEIALLHDDSITVHTFIDHQTWRYDEKTKHWWLTSGLPDFSSH
jgi:hypothetical protein